MALKSAESREAKTRLINRRDAAKSNGELMAKAESIGASLV